MTTPPVAASPQAGTQPGKAPRGWPWLAFVIGLLVAQALASSVVLWIAVSDPSEAVEPDYDTKALHWDEYKQALADSAALGWQAAVQLEPHRLVLRLVDADGRPVRGAQVEALVFHRARGNDRRTLQLEESEPGRYVAQAPFPRAGLWEVRLEARRDSARWLQREVIERSGKGGR